MLAGSRLCQWRIDGGFGKGRDGGKVRQHAEGKEFWLNVEILSVKCKISYEKCKMYFWSWSRKCGVLVSEDLESSYLIK